VGFDSPGISRYDGKKWKSFYDQGAPNERTVCMLITQDGTLWVAAQDETLCRYDGKHWATATCTHLIQDMVEDQAGRIWMAVGNAVVVASLK
jgi:ligand-binding sensor domain-containing protein